MHAVLSTIEEHLRSMEYSVDHSARGFNVYVRDTNGIYYPNTYIELLADTITIKWVRQYSRLDLYKKIHVGDPQLLNKIEVTIDEWVLCGFIRGNFNGYEEFTPCQSRIKDTLWI